MGWVNRVGYRLTLDGRRAHNEGLLEGLCLGTQLSRASLQWHTLLSQAWYIYSCLLVQTRLVVQ